ncbi:MAG: efflux RND transporter permease subunit, partial [Alphaproteobacteria bacterium]
MNALTRFGLDRSRFTILLMAAVILQGALLYKSFPAREDPAVTIRTVVATSLFAGMAPERVERLIAQPMERKLREIPEIDEIKTNVQAGKVTINAMIADSVDDLDPVFTEIRDKMADVARELPSGTQGPFVNTDFGAVAIASIAMTAEGFSYQEMFDAADDLRAEIYKINGIAKVDIVGKQAERIWLEVDTGRFGAIGAQLPQLIADLQAQNIVAPAGSINADGTSIQLEVSGDFGSVAEIETMLTQLQGSQSFVRLQDLVTVRRGYEEPKNKPVYFNGRPALVLSVGMQDGVDIERLGADLVRTVSRFEQGLPIGFVLDYATYQPEKV